MPLRSVSIDKAGEVGLTPDYPATEAPPNAWTAGRNVRFADGEVVTFPGHDVGGENSLQDAIWSLHTVSSATQHYWVNLGPAAGGGVIPKAYAFDGTTFHDISPSTAFTSARNQVITGGFLNGFLIVNNQQDVPHTWDLNTGNVMVPLANWDTNWRARAIATFKGYIMAVGITDTGNLFPNRIKWSDEASAGALPGDWDETDPTIQAGELELADTTAALVGLAQMRNEMVVYTERECAALALVGGSTVFRARTIATQAGAISERAIGRVFGKHVVITDNDIVMNDGQNIQSIADERTRRFMFSQLDEDNYGFAFTQVHRLKNEVWFCFPSAGMDYCDLALVWNWSDNTWGVRDLPVGCIAAADGIDIVGLSTALWTEGGAAATWDVEDGSWDERSFNALGGVMLITGDDTNTGASGAQINRVEQGNTFGDDNRTFRLERLGMRPDDLGRDVTVREVWIRATGDPFTVRVGYQNEPNGAVAWGSIQTYDPESQKKITCRVTGKYPCLQIESEGDFNSRVHGVRMMYSLGAQR